MGERASERQPATRRPGRARPAQARPQGLSLLVLAPLGVALALAGCGGGLYLGFDVGSGFDDPPSVSLVLNVDAARPGQALRLSAAASDDFGVERVQFLRIEPDGSLTLLGSDAAEPYVWDATAPATPAAEWHFVARATDSAGQQTESATVSVRVIR